MGDAKHNKCSPPVPYGAEYYHSHLGSVPYERNDYWLSMFGNIADEIARSLSPKRVFDAGCAMGFLVEMFWDRGIEADGRDISEYAISKVRADVRDHCQVGSIAEPIDSDYDLVTCIEVLEHMPEDEARQAITSMTKVTDKILFSSTPTDFSEPSHINVRPVLYWLNAFATEGFVPRPEFDASFIAPHAFLLERSNRNTGEVDIRSFVEVLRLRIALADSGTRIESYQATLSRLRQQVADMEAATDAKTTTLESNIQRLHQQLGDAGELQLLFSEESKRQHGLMKELTELLAECQRQTDDIRQALDQKIVECNECEDRINQLEVDSANRVNALTVEVERWKTSSQQFENQFRSILTSSFWKATGPLRKLVDKFPRTKVLKNVLRRGDQSASTIPLSPTSQIAAARQLSMDFADDWGVVLRDRFPVLNPLRLRIGSEKSHLRVNLVTDSINGGSLFGGVGTAIIWSVLLAERIDAQLRLITRTESPEPSNVRMVLEANGLTWQRNIEFCLLDLNGNSTADVSSDDLFLTTSWWTTHAALQCVSPEQIVYLVQEDERMFYPLGDDYLRCSEVLANQELCFVVNSKLLFDHFQRDGYENIANNGVWFEPAFPKNQYFLDDRPKRWKDKRTFMFYARPGNLRNLYYRGLEAIGESISVGVLPPNDWQLVFVGKDLSAVSLPSGVRPQLIHSLGWSDYGALIRRVDVGLTLMYTPHPSYPPLDLAASGAIAVTNRFGNKDTLDSYSKNIVVTGLRTEDLIKGIADAVAMSADVQKRKENYELSTLERDWKISTDRALDFVCRRLQHV